MSWRDIAVVQAEGGAVDAAASKRRVATLRKRFERIKERLARRAREEGILP